MNPVYDAISRYAPPHRRTPSGWTSFNCQQCVHMGNHRPDTKKRGGHVLKGDLVTYNCHNCGFKTGWSVGSPLGKKMSNLLSNMGMPEDELKKLSFQLWSLWKRPVKPRPQVMLPMGARLIQDWIDNDLEDLDFLAVAEEVQGFSDAGPDGYDAWADMYWTDIEDPEFGSMRRRYIRGTKHGWSATMIDEPARDENDEWIDFIVCRPDFEEQLELHASS